ncbi:Glycerophosphoryl diester phosphodiesterase family domain containing protein [Rhypophila decipiens]
MRFGENLHSYLVTEWDEHYVDYHRLKRLIKSLAGTKFDVTKDAEIFTSLSSAIVNLVSFFQTDRAAIDFPTPFAPVFAFANPDNVANSVSHLGPNELVGILAICARKRHDLRQLSWFQKVNSEAIDRILAKLDRFISATGNHHPAYGRVALQWENARQDIHVYLVKVESAIAAMEREARNSPNWAVDETQALRSFVPFKNPLAVLLISAGMAKGTEVEDAATNAVMRHLQHDLTGKAVNQLYSKCYWGDRWALVSAARYGLRDICEFILTTLTSQKYFTDYENFETSRTQRIAVYEMVLTALQVSVSQNHTTTAQYLIAVVKRTEFGGSSDWWVDTSEKCLSMAIRNQNDDLVSTLAPSACLGFIIYGRNVLHLAAQLGRADYVGLLLEVMRSHRLVADTQDESRGWTPLFFAAYHGHFEVVELLLGAGFSQCTDHLGWTAKEYAAFRGHLRVAALFPSTGKGLLKGGPASPPTCPPSIDTPHPPVTCGENEYIVLVNLGATQKNRTAWTPTSISHTTAKYNSKIFHGHNIELEISVPGSGVWNAQEMTIPALSDNIIDPFLFRVPKHDEPELMFRFIRADTGQNGGPVLLGSGTALLTSHMDHFGPNRQSLIREQTVPILHKETMAKVGVVTFTFVIIKPFMHPRVMDMLPDTIQFPALARESASSPPLLIGHRGLGQNFSPADQTSNPQLQIGENTVSSFLTAARLGASFVEFDVQLTRDLQPVIYHDFSLSESGTDVPIHDVTLEQYLYASNIQSPRGNPLSTLGHPSKSTSSGTGRPRSRSLGSQFEHGAIQVHDRMKHTVDYQLKGYKPNTRGEGIIQDTFATLKEILTQLPDDIGLDVEVKYPRLHETRDAGVASVAIELNTFVDTILQTIYNHSSPEKQRRIFLSSFTPEICILLSVKQGTWPVFFITNAGKVPMVDQEIRAASLQVAVKFAKKWNLAGVVFACEPLLICPRLVAYVRNRGLVCASYGVLNNEVDKVEAQVEAGVDIIIADKIGLIARALKARFGDAWE